MDQTNLRDKILKNFEQMQNSCTGLGKNPYIVNVVTYSGFGFSLNGDAIAVIPQYNSTDAKSNGIKEPRFINLSAFARKLAGCKHTINIFLIGSCRWEFKEEMY